MSQDPLFPLPRDAKPLPKPRPKRSAATFTRYRTKRRTLCDECIRDIHARGVSVAPYPMPARWRRKYGDVVELLCETHCKQAKGQ